MFKEYDRNRGIKVNIFNLESYDQAEDISFNFAIVKGKNVVLDNDGNPTVFDSDDVFPPDRKVKKIFINDQIELPLNVERVAEEHQKDQQKVFVIFKFVNDKGLKEQDYGWYGHPFFKSPNKFNSGRFKMQLLVPPVPTQTPIQIQKFQKKLTRLEFEI